MPDSIENETSDHSAGKPDADAVIDHVRKLLFLPRPPALPPAFEGDETLRDIHQYIISLRMQLSDYAKGDFSRDITLRGATAGLLKSLQANMRHLIWQMHQVEGGDFSQRVDFMGEFSDTFNKMVKRLDDALTELKVKEDELMALTRQLEIEVERRGAALDALQKSEENLKYLAEHDPLTGLLNRRSFSARAEMQIARDSIMGQPCCLALMDVDHFKKVNDTHGHLNGDLALKHIARIGCSTLRQDDIMGRYGGEEFVFLFPKASAAQGRMAAERIRQLIAAKPVDMSGSMVTLTASFGVVAIPANITSEVGGDLLVYATSLADNALYQAKENGRNRVEETPFPTDTKIFTTTLSVPSVRHHQAEAEAEAEKNRSGRHSASASSSPNASG